MLYPFFNEDINAEFYLLMSLIFAYLFEKDSLILFEFDNFLLFIFILISWLLFIQAFPLRLCFRDN
jgi:hypothetical protein